MRASTWLSILELHAAIMGTFRCIFSHFCSLSRAPASHFYLAPYKSSHIFQVFGVNAHINRWVRSCVCTFCNSKPWHVAYNCHLLTKGTRGESLKSSPEKRLVFFLWKKGDELPLRQCQSTSSTQISRFKSKSTGIIQTVSPPYAYNNQFGRSYDASIIIGILKPARARVFAFKVYYGRTREGGREVEQGGRGAGVTCQMGGWA